MFLHLSRRSRRNEAGFTLIELLVVIVILGILSAVVVFAVRGVNDKGKGAAVATDERSIRTAEEAYCARAGQYASMDQLTGAAKADDGNTYRFLSEPSTYNSDVNATKGGGPCNGWSYTITTTPPGGGNKGPTGTFVAAANPLFSSDLAVLAALPGPGGRVLHVGKEVSSGTFKAEIYDPAGNSWAAVTDPPAIHELRIIGAFTLDSAVLVGFGYPTPLWFLFTPATGLWTQTGGSAYVQRNISSTATLISGTGCAPNCGKVLWAGGNDDLTATPDQVMDVQRSSADLYDPVTGIFTATTAMGIPRGDFASAGLRDGRVLVAGGDQPNGARSYQLYDPVGATWSVSKPLPAALGNPRSLTVLADRRVLAISEDVNLFSVYDPASDAWTEPAACTCETTTPTLLRNGRVMASGSPGGSWLYTPGPIGNPSTPGIWAPGPAKPLRYKHPALLMANGQVLLVSGEGNNAQSTAELYKP